MGTRNVTVVKLDNKPVLVKYCQWDGYPTGVGADICNYIKNNYNLRKLKKGIKSCQVIDDELIKEKFDKYLEETHRMEYEEKKKYQLDNVPFFTRDTNGGQVLNVIQEKGGILIGDSLENELKYAKGNDEWSFSLEYVYEVDLDKKQLAVFDGVYKGKPCAVFSFNKIKRAKDVYKIMEKLETELRGE